MGEDHGTFNSVTKVAERLTFAKLHPDDMDTVSDVQPIVSLAAWA